MLYDEAAGDDYDAAVAMLQQGALLRQLREMERQDEEERARTAATDVTTRGDGDESTLVYQSYLSQQLYYDDYKHVNYKFVDFGMIGDRHLVVQQDRSVGKGGLIWDAAFILGDHLIRHSEWNSNKTVNVIELGAGTGLTGLMLASAFPDCQVHLTDLPLLQPLLQANTKDMPNASVGVLEWGTTASVGKYDVIIGADVVASIYDSLGLVKTIYDLATDRSRIYLSIRDRLLGSIDTFEAQLKCLFTTVLRCKADSSNKNQDVWILQVTGRRDNQ